MRLKATRENRGLTQEELAIRANLNRVTIAKLETGRSEPTLRTAKRLADALGCKVDDLIDNNEETA